MLKRIQRENEKSNSLQAKKKKSTIASSSSVHESSPQFANENEITLCLLPLVYSPLPFGHHLFCPALRVLRQSVSPFSPLLSMNHSLVFFLVKILEDTPPLSSAEPISLGDSLLRAVSMHSSS